MGNIHTTDFLIVGAGIIGLTLAKSLIDQGAAKITVLEKESGLGFHASGRNSGVLHAGIYYPPHTLKAKLCLKGNLLWQAWCEANNLPLMKTGKVIVAHDETELPMLSQLYERAAENGAKVELIDEHQLAAIEPNAKTCQKALYSHWTAMVDNHAILAALYKALKQSGKVEFWFNTQFSAVLKECVVKTTSGNIQYQQIINTAGAYADTIAHHFGVGQDYYLIPFKGIYQKLIPAKAHLVKGNIYPVPHLGNPFLGVHFTKNIHGDVYVGPTAIPAFGRENYGIIRGIDSEMFKIIKNEIILYFTNPDFRQVALSEPKKYFSRYFYRDAKRLVKQLEPDWLMPAAKVGIRPQLINLREKKLVMDFLVIQEKHSLHVLNAVSPAFTSAMAFADYLVSTYL